MEGRTIIVGGGGFARELYNWVGECAQAGTLPPVGGYVDDAGDVLRNRDRYNMPFLGSIDDCEIREGDQFVIALGSPSGKRRVHARLSARGARFATLIHPNTSITNSCEIGEGAIICPGCIIGPESRLGRFVTLNSGSGTGHDAVIGEFSVLASAIVVAGMVEIAEDVSIGSAAVILPSVRVGAGAVVGPGSIVYRSVRAGSTVYAPPAKQLRGRKGTEA
jgi:sugar O-acyltransferase (sialic acid O-acetyltransferase NeuD family)